MELDDRILAPAYRQVNSDHEPVSTTNLQILQTCKKHGNGGIAIYAMVVCSLRDLNFAAADGHVVVDSRQRLKKPEKPNIPWLRIAHV